MGLPADWSFMDQKTHFLFVLQGPEIIWLTTSMPVQIKHQALTLLRTPFSASFPLLSVHIAEVKNFKRPSLYQQVSHLGEQMGYFAFSWLRCNTGLAWTLNQFRQIGASTSGFLYPLSRFLCPLLSPKEAMFKLLQSDALRIPPAPELLAQLQEWVHLRLYTP